MSTLFYVVTSPSVSGSLTAFNGWRRREFPMVSVLGLISLTIKAHCGLQQKEARAECAAVAGVGAAPGRSCVF